MGAPKQKWTAEEEEALRRGVLKHGAGKWRTIQKDPEFSPTLSSRSNIDLKDKWRNLSFGGGQGSREKVKRITGPASSSSPSSLSLILPTSSRLTEASANADAEKKPQDGKNPQKYGAMIVEALSELNEPNGSEVSAIQGFIEQRHEVQVQPNFRRVLTGKLRRLVETKKIEKIDNKYYKLTDSFATKTPSLPKASTQKQKEPSKSLKAPKNLGIFAAVSPALESAAAAAAKVADAEAKAHLAHEHMMEAERILKMAEDTESLLTLAEEIYDRCSRGEIITVNPVSQKEF